MGASDSKLNLLLIGRSGNGKSSTGNSIVGAKIFSAFGHTTSATRRAKKYSLRLWNKDITVMDTPGLVDTWMDEMEGCYFARKIMEDSFKICEEGFHTVLIVLNFTNRYSEEEKKVVRMLKEIFGQNLFQFAILIFTHGDNFDQEHNIKDAEASQNEFKRVCSSVEGDLKVLLKACNHRAVLFHNNPNYTGNRGVELRTLQSHAEGIKRSKKMYTRWYFEAARKSREELVLTICLDPLKTKVRKALETLEREFQLITNQQTTLSLAGNELLHDFNTTAQRNLLSFRDAVTNLTDNFRDSDTNSAKHDLLMNVKRDLVCPTMSRLQKLLCDIETLLNPEESKFNLKRKIRELLQYIKEEAHGTGLLNVEIEMVESFQSVVEEYDTRRTITTEIE